MIRPRDHGFRASDLEDESPSLRDYRYIERDSRTYVIEPRERTIIEEID